MATFSKRQLMDLWTSAGGDPKKAGLMASIALAESGGRAGIVNSIGATGLWQIHPGGPQYKDPLKNAETAVAKFKTQGLGAWEAYTNGSYKKFLGPAGGSPSSGGRGAGTTSGGSGGASRTRTITETTPGVDNSAARAFLVQSFLGEKNADPVAFALQAKQVQDIPESKRTIRLPGLGGGSGTTAGTAQAANFGAGKGAAGRRSPVAHMTSEGGTHPTMGLAGYPAHDYFAKPGSAAVAPVNGKVIRLSGHDPANGPTQGPHGPLGYSVYIQGDDGHTYFLTHMGSRTVRAGQRVRAGQKIGTVADYDKYGTPSHIHMGVH